MFILVMFMMVLPIDRASRDDSIGCLVVLWSNFDILVKIMDAA